MARGGQRAGPIEQACEAHAAPALPRVEATGAVERRYEPVAGPKLCERQTQRTGDQAAQLQAIGGFVQRLGAVGDPGGRGKGVAGGRAGLVGAGEATPLTAQAEHGRHRALQLPDEIGPDGDRARPQELPPPGEVPPPERLCAHDSVDGHGNREHDPEREVPVQQVVAARRELGAARPSHPRQQRRRHHGDRGGARRGAAVPARRLREPSPHPPQLSAQDGREREAARAVHGEDPGVTPLAGEQGHHAGREQQPDEQRQAPIGGPRRHSTGERTEPLTSRVPAGHGAIRGSI